MNRAKEIMDCVDEAIDATQRERMHAYRDAVRCAVEELVDALDDCVRQFGYGGNGKRSTGGLSALEAAFKALGLEDPHPLDPGEMCDEPGCKEPSTCGTPTPTGYRRTCGPHMPREVVSEGQR